ncbi:hypothetical protein QR680_015113 [Steinernema hermaphroditum]|uniref:5'-AMP-activated protein kinase subunit beta-1 n=1 Tax=Steinernema hermaphroditum TaxID=289476 RepID=A0AA39IB81_9BILA|nr:hypothetical protein QR680_015113 [Steinernema hermaphroditum]
MIHCEWSMACATRGLLFQIGGIIFIALRLVFIFFLYVVSLFAIPSLIEAASTLWQITQAEEISLFSTDINDINSSPIGHQCSLQKVTILGRFRKACKVFVTGSFVQWNLLLEMRETARNVWMIQLQLPYGHHSLRFVVDGHWRLEDSYPVSADGNGIIHNVMHVSG